jgi:hypothetical protein
MKIVRQSDSELVLQDGRLWISALLALGALPLFYTASFAGWGPNSIAGILFLAGALVWMHQTTVVFDATQRQVRWKRVRLFRTTSGTVPFSDIAAISTETSPGRGGSLYRLVLLTPAQSLPLARSLSGSRDHCAATRQAIQHFLQERGVSVPAFAAPVRQPRLAQSSGSVRSLLLQGRTTDAIHLLETTQHIDLPTATRRVKEIAATLRSRHQH